MLRYHGYRGEYTFDPRARLAYGRVLTMRGTIVFSGTSLAELQEDMRRAIDAYLSRCAREGAEPAPPIPDLPDGPSSIVVPRS